MTGNEKESISGMSEERIFHESISGMREKGVSNSGMTPMIDGRALRQFIEHVDNNPGPRWTGYLREFEQLMKAYKITGDDKVEWLLHFGGADIQKLNLYLPNETIEGESEYRKLIDRLDGYFKKKILYVLERSKLRTMEPRMNERIDSFVIRLREQGDACNYDDKVEIMIIDQIISTCKSTRIKERLCEKDWSLNEIISIVSLMELNENEKKANMNSTEINFTSKQTDTRTCFACGRKGHIASSSQCPANGKRCNRCKEIGHFEIKCRQKKRFEPDKRNNESRKRKYQAHLIEDEDKEEVKKSYVFNVIQKEKKTNAEVDCIVGGVPLTMMIDSGADCNIIGKHNWSTLKFKQVNIWNDKPGTDGKEIYGYGSKRSLPILGNFITNIEIQGKTTIAKFYVVDMDTRALLSRETAIKLDVLKIGLQVNTITKIFPKMKDIMIDIPMNTDIKITPQAYRRIPAPLEERVNKKLDELLDADIIERVNGHSQYISAMVIQPKEDGDIRICLDLRQINKAILREVHPIPVIEEIILKVGNSKWFSLMDIKQAFHQIEISPKSRPITTFITSKGLYRYKRLLFGISCAPEIFQKVMENILANCEGVIVFIDDILVYGQTKQIHDSRLQQVQNRIQQYNIMLNDKKCIYGVNEIEFLGFKFSSKGVDITKSKIAALQEFREPNDVSELRSFLGFVTFLKKFIPQMSTVAAPLNRLLEKNIPFKWNETEREAFLFLKKTLCEAKTLGHYNVKDETEVIADASPVGLGAVLIQKGVHGTRVICYASRSLSKQERRYAQTEKEALALVWAVEKFHYYLYGKVFYLITDHRPLEVIFSPRSRPCLRIERWVLRLQSYNFKVIYKPGKENIADVFSRLLNVNEESNSFDEISECWVRQIVEIARPCAITIQELKEASTESDIIQEVKTALETGKWEKKLKQFELIQNELCFSDGILLRGTRIVIPESLQIKTLELAHLAHGGAAGMKQRLRKKVWWEKIDSMTEKFVQSCRECILNSLPNPPEPLKRRELPDSAWIDVGVDFIGPLGVDKDQVLIMVDYYSRYQEIKIMPEGKADGKNTVQIMKEIFGRLGYPMRITSDNGCQFTSMEMKLFCKEVGIYQNFTTPMSPQQNGEVERQNRDLLHFIRTSNSEGVNWKEKLPIYILMKHTTVHATTGKTPAELFYGREIRDNLPSIIHGYNPMDEEVREKDFYMKMKGKEIADKRRHAVESEITTGDRVVIKNFKRSNKLDSYFDENEYQVVEKKGKDTIVQRESDGKRYRRNVEHMKKIKDKEGREQEEFISDEAGMEIIPQREEERGGKRIIKKPARYLE